MQSSTTCSISSLVPSLVTTAFITNKKKATPAPKEKKFIVLTFVIVSILPSPLISAEVSQLISSITELPVTRAVYLEWEEFSKQEVKSKHVADLADTCVEVATKAETSDHPSVDSVLPSIAQGTQNLLAIAAATKISFKEAEPIKALLPDSNFSKEEKTNAKAEIHISRTEKASKEAEEMNKLATSVDKLMKMKSLEPVFICIMPYCQGSLKVPKLEFFINPHI